MSSSASQRIVVMAGGWSAEREVSLRSGAAAARALRGLGHEVIEFDPRGEDWDLPDGTRAVFLALHGTYGEDGGVQARLEALGVPYTGCDANASRVAFDKALTKARCQAAGVRTPAGIVVDRLDASWPEGVPGPWVVKPVCQGSSVGLVFLDSPEGWHRALATAFEHDRRVLVESRIVGRELTVGILDGAALPVVEVRPKCGVYDYGNKYTSGATEYTCPAELGSEVEGAVQRAALGAFAAVGGRDYGRVDVMVDGEGAAWVLEVNTLPGMTETSLLPKAAAAAGLGFPSLCERILEMALRRCPLAKEVGRVA